MTREERQEVNAAVAVEIVEAVKGLSAEERQLLIAAAERLPHAKQWLDALLAHGSFTSASSTSNARASAG